VGLDCWLFGSVVEVLPTGIADVCLTNLDCLLTLDWSLRPVSPAGAAGGLYWNLLTLYCQIPLLIGVACLVILGLILV
jgi:hypothetical protein